MTGPRISIGKHYTPRPTLYGSRTGTGCYQHYMPPMSEDDIALQVAMLDTATAKRCRLRLVTIALAVVVAVAVMVLAS
jgi:hypothetical protein